MYTFKLMADIQEAECFEFTYQIVPPQGAFREGQKNVPLRTYLPPPPIYFCIRPRNNQILSMVSCRLGI